MSQELDVIIVEEDPSICRVISNIIKGFYIWGDMISFTDIDDAVANCMGLAVFVLDIYVGVKSGFDFLDQIGERFPSAREDTIIITGNASNEVVNRCISSDITYLLEKPIRSYALQSAVRVIAMKYIKFAKRLFQNPTFSARVKTV